MFLLIPPHPTCAPYWFLAKWKSVVNMRPLERGWRIFCYGYLSSWTKTVVHLYLLWLSWWFPVFSFISPLLHSRSLYPMKEFTGSVFFLHCIAKAAWAKPNVSHFCEPRQCAKRANPFKVNVNAFSRQCLVLLCVSGFLKVSKNLIWIQNLADIHFL